MRDCTEIFKAERVDKPTAASTSRYWSRWNCFTASTKRTSNNSSAFNEDDALEDEASLLDQDTETVELVVSSAVVSSTAARLEFVEEELDDEELAGYTARQSATGSLFGFSDERGSVYSPVMRNRRRKTAICGSTTQGFKVGPSARVGQPPASARLW